MSEYCPKAIDQIDGSQIRELHAIVPMANEGVPLLEAAQENYVNAAWIPWEMAVQNREKVHERVMKILREVAADKISFENLKEVESYLATEVARLKSSREERAQAILECVENFKAKLEAATE